MSSFPPIEELLPHRGTLLLVDRLVAYEADGAVVETTPRADAWYADENGAMPAWFGIELMAQAVAAHVALTKRLAGLPVKMGALLGTRAYRPGVAGFPAGVSLRIRARESFRDESGLAAYVCAIESSGDSVLAESTLKVYEPDDFRAFMEGQEP